jgi:hypothetical protein
MATFVRTHLTTVNVPLERERENRRATMLDMAHDKITWRFPSHTLKK